MTEATTAPDSTTTTAPTAPGAADQAASRVATTIAGGAAETAPAKTAAPQPSWQDRIVTAAGGDKSHYKALEPYADESAWVRAQFALRQKMASGEYKAAPQPFPEKGTDEDKANWRKEHGVPDKPELYVEKLAAPKGFVPGENDKPGLDRLAKYAIEKNWSQERYNDAIAAYWNEVENVTNARDEADGQYHKQAEDALRADWGQDYRRNVNAVHNLINGAPQGVRERMMGGRTADGRLIGDDPHILKWLADLSMQANPHASILPPGGTIEGLSSRKAEIDKLISDRRSDYYRGPNADKLQAEYRQILEVEERTRSRAA